MVDLRLTVAGHTECYSGTLAGQRTLSSLACSHLETNENAKSLTLLPAESEALPAQDASTGIEIHAELEAQPITLRAVHTLQRSYFTRPDTSFWVDADGSCAALTHCAHNPVPWRVGPLLILALARLGVYCLHASAVLTARSASTSAVLTARPASTSAVLSDGDAAATVFVGHSGAGKSSLARAVSKRAGAQRLCDDITPIALRAGRLYVLPRFPQLKLSAVDQNLPEWVPLKRLVLLNAAQTERASEHKALTQRELFEALTRHTVATRLYSATDTRIWWQVLPQIMAALSDARSIRPAFDAQAPEQAMLAAFDALDALDTLCG